MFGMGTSVSSSEDSPERGRRTGRPARSAWVSKRERYQATSEALSCGAKHHGEDPCRLACGMLCGKHAMPYFEKKIKVVKYSPVSTGQLKRLPVLHHQPINLVVFQGALGPKSNET